MNNYQQFSPQYFQQQFESQMQQYNTLYNQNRNIPMGTGFVGQYVNSYDEVEKAQVNINGMPTMFVANGVFWIKKFVNGQPYISAYRFEPMNNVGEPQQQQQNQSEQEIDMKTLIDTIGKSLDDINSRLSALEVEKGGK